MDIHDWAFVSVLHRLRMLADDALLRDAKDEAERLLAEARFVAAQMQLSQLLRLRGRGEV